MFSERLWRGMLAAAVLPLFWFTCTVAAQQNPSSQGTRAPLAGPLAEAESVLAQGNPDQAIAILSRHLHSHPKDIPARLALGQAYVMTGKDDQAEAEFTAVLRDAPDNVAALTSVGEIYLKEDQFDTAETMLGRAAKVKGSDAHVRMQWAVVLARLHKYREAQSALAGLTPPNGSEERVAFHRLKASIASGLGNASVAASEMEKALALNPYDVGLTIATAVAELQSENWNRAAALTQPLYSRTRDPQTGLALLDAQLGMHADFHTTLESLHGTALKPEEELAFRQRLAEVLISHSEFSASIEELTRTLELDPTRGDLTYNLALAQFKAGRFDDSLANAEKCKALNDNADLEDLLGDIQEARGDNLAAARSYQAAVTLAPNEEKYRLSLAVEFIRHQNFDAARAVLKQADQLWPKSWRIQLALGMVEHFAGSDEEASRILMHTAELSPEPATALRYLGDIQLDQASAPSAAAIAQLCDYTDRHPKDGKLQYYCGAMLFRKDYVSADKTHANEILRRLRIAANPLGKDPEPDCQLGKVYRWLEQWQEARGELETCVRLDPNSADGHYRLAQVYQHFGLPERSKQELTLYKAASQRIADENAHRDETMKTFLYTIQNEVPDHK